MSELSCNTPSHNKACTRTRRLDVKRLILHAYIVHVSSYNNIIHGKTSLFRRCGPMKTHHPAGKKWEHNVPIQAHYINLRKILFACVTVSEKAFSFTLIEWLAEYNFITITSSLVKHYISHSNNHDNDNRVLVQPIYKRAYLPYNLGKYYLPV